MTPTDLGDPLARESARTPWLMTLADLALLLLGFLVLVQATGNREALAKSLRERFGEAQAAVPVAAAAADFAPGSATLGDAAPLVAWAREALADPRVAVTVTGAAASEEGGVLLAADRARAVAAALAAAGLPTGRLRIATTAAPTARAFLTIAFAGEPGNQP